MNTFRKGLEYNNIFNMTIFFYKSNSSVYNSKNTLACKVNNISLEINKKMSV